MRLAYLSRTLAEKAYSKAYGLMSFLGQFPISFRFFNILRGKDYKSRIAGRDTDIVIEGFPRSANTFAVVAFRFFREASGSGLNIAHHLHMPAQVILARKYELPCIVLIRKPVEAVASLRLSKPLLSGEQAFLSYSKFYTRLLKYRDAFVIAKFEEVTNSFDRTIEKLNAHFETRFEAFVHSEENVEKCFERIDFINDKIFAGDITQLAKPEMPRNAMKNEILNDLLSKNLAKYRENAEAVYREFVR